MNVEVTGYDNRDAKRLSEIITRNLLEINIVDYELDEMVEMAKGFQPDDIQRIMRKRHAYVAKVEGYVVGTGGITNSFSNNEREYWVLTVFVDPDFHGKGIGRKIMERLEEKVDELGGGKMIIPSSITSHKFYYNLGYRYIGGTAVINENKQYMLEKRL